MLNVYKNINFACFLFACKLYMYYICVSKVNQNINLITTIMTTQTDYSLGFQRLQKLSLRKRKNAFLALYLEGFTEIPENKKELKIRLEKMTEQEYTNFKRNN